MALKKFTKVKFLEEIGRPLLVRLLAKHEALFVAEALTLPADTLSDEAFFAALQKLAVVEGGLPEVFVEELYSIEAMANWHGRDRLKRGLEQERLPLTVEQTVTDAEFAIVVLLAAPKLFSQKLAETKVEALSSFEHHCSPTRIDRSETFAFNDDATTTLIKSDFDSWLDSQGDGDERITEIDAYKIKDEQWFLIRRADPFARVPIGEAAGFTIKRFRPARDLVAVYSPKRDELRIFGKSAREKTSLKKIIGLRLFGDDNYFSVWKAFTLDPLLNAGPDCLTVRPGDGLDWVKLTSLETRRRNATGTVEIIRDVDLFAFWETSGRGVPTGCDLVKAGFQVKFTGQAEPRTIYLKAGNYLRVARHCDAAAVQRWLSNNGFRDVDAEAGNRLAA